MVFVKLRNNIRFVDTEEVGFSIKTGEVKELPEKYVRSYIIKDMLFHGQLLVMQGEILFVLKSAKILLSGSDPNLLYGFEFEKYFTKDLINDTIIWLEESDIPVEVREKITGNIPLDDKVKEFISVNYGIENSEAIIEEEIKQPVIEVPVEKKVIKKETKKKMKK